jgi:hypothetical protein
MEAVWPPKRQWSTGIQGVIPKMLIPLIAPAARKASTIYLAILTSTWNRKVTANRDISVGVTISSKSAVLFLRLGYTISESGLRILNQIFRKRKRHTNRREFNTNEIISGESEPRIRLNSIRHTTYHSPPHPPIKCQTWDLWIKIPFDPQQLFFHWLYRPRGPWTFFQFHDHFYRR